jgi:predicted SnoaL-like aldol condensation-catalyzing enzyme
MKILRCVLVAVLCTAGMNTSAATKAAATPKQLVLDFYKLALADGKVKQAFAEYMSADFVEHSADSAGGTAQSTVEFLTDLMRKTPHAKWEVVRAIAEEDLVFLHVRFTPAEHAAPIAIGEIFRVKDGRIVEHWDIIQHSPENAVNPNSMF